ncbi:N-acetyltransferase DgcN [Sphingomonas mucosissima]|uniref:EBNA-1 nuclear protein n=1 Tax=Sphingomonas mucosissima TaxID=370959 RepID=A0A245ZRY0_9SPHN|nr:N-acetyltransferase DgcN [Sphingomonas mucosissima]OWK32480.1 hypothetical protein SPMU_08120 [Sphingomonas mucosissima]
MTIPAPYLLYLGHSDDEFGLKTSRGLATFRRDDCVGEWRHDDCPFSFDLPRMDAAAGAAAGAKTLVLGIANAGGRFPEWMMADALAAIAAGMNLACGLHQRLKDEPRLVEAAKAAGVQLFDVRDPRPDLPVGNGKKRAGKRLLTVGTDCSVGKMYTTLCLRDALRDRGVAADFRATGQTGILIAGDGVPLDAVVADFIAGAIEDLAPARTDDGWDLIEGQGSLFHPAFAGVSTGLLHGAQAEALVMCHDPTRPHMRGLPHYPLVDLAECIDANLRVARLTSPDVRFVGIALNTAKLGEDEARRLLEVTADEHNLPCTDPFRFGAEAIIDHLLTANVAYA